jgi:ribonuclease HII
MLKQSYSGFSLEAGTDEAGRGCLSGPVVAAAVILPKDFSHPFLTDSKQLSEKKKRPIKTHYRSKCLGFWRFFCLARRD